MLPKARRRATRRLGWPFGRRGNRRVRVAAPAPLPGDGDDGQPASGRVRAPRPSLRAAAWTALRAWRRTLLVAGVAMALAAGAWGGRFYVTHARHFAVRNVRVTAGGAGASGALVHISADALAARANVPVGVNLFAVDREEVARTVSQEPWVARAQVRRELPSTVVIDVVERQAACAVALGALYLSDGDGNVFKRATPEEAAGLPVVTGIARDEYVAQPERARVAVRLALAAAAAWRARDGRAPLGELHVDRIAGVTLYTDRGVGVRIGAVDDTLADRLRRFDAVTGALQASGEEARLIYVDNRARPDRVTVKLASAKLSAHSGLMGAAADSGSASAQPRH